MRFVSSQLSGEVFRSMLRAIGRCIEDRKFCETILPHLFGKPICFLEGVSPRELTPPSLGAVYVFTDASQEGRQGLEMGLGCTTRVDSWPGLVSS